MKQNKKVIRREIDCASFADTPLAGLSPLMQRIYAVRGIRSPAELEHGLAHLLSWQSLMGIDGAVSLLVAALTGRKKILVVGDFDADGATGTAVAVRGFRSLGAAAVDYLVPNRFAFGYGLTPGLVEVARTKNPDVLVTVDNGIANHAGVQAARDAGMQVIVTDHHLPAGQLPAAHAIVNPNQAGDGFPSKNMAGVGVIFYVCLALRHRLRELGWFVQQNIPEPKLASLLDLVALGTIADVVPLDHNNRILVQQGLQRIRAGQCAPGITALIEISQRNQARLRAADLGFAIAPRLNAAGRLDDMSLGIECLLCDSLPEARKKAAHLNELNLERREIEQDMQMQALRAVEKISRWQQPVPDTHALPWALCLFEPDWHQGVIGIVAGRMKERLHRPVIAFAPDDAAGKFIKGSARSIPGLHIRDALADVDARHPGLVEKFGGHAMAAGLLLRREALETFTAAFCEAVAGRITEKHLQHVVESDGELLPEEHTLSFAETLMAAGPWGQGFPEPVFDGIFSVLEQRIVGGRHLKLTLGQADRVLPAIAFNVDLEQWPDHRAQKLSLAYRMDVNEYQGRRQVQLVVEHMEAV